jgi:3-hydroxyisobutyrate dehydrogenase-like beta-hydroxyacid dehydrogenase
MERVKIGFIGLGIMGESMCENILKKSNTKIYVYNRTKEKADKLVNLGAIGAESVKEIGENCNVIITMVPKNEHVQVVIGELLKVIKSGTILIEMSTIDPKVSCELAKKVAEKGVYMIDAPVVKSKPAAIAGELGIYVGGNKEVFEKIKPILQFMGKDIIHMGENGSGLVMKICHNMLVAQIQNGINEMLTLSEAAGLKFDDVVTAISYGGGQTFYLDSKKATIKSGDFSPKFSVENMHKDIHLALKLADEVNVKIPGAENAANIYDKAIENGMSKEDFSATLKVVNKS